MTSKAVVVISGGLDSTTLLHHIHSQGWECTGLSFDYGQRHRKELHYAAMQCEILDVEHLWINLRKPFEVIANLGTASSLITNADVPEGHYGEESMKQTVVPNRNMILLSIASGVAVSLGADAVALGVHSGDHYIYPDCRPDFFAYAGAAVIMGNEGFISPGFQLWTPFIEKDKNWIAQRAFDLNVDIASTWSCYKGGDIHCGRCGTCVERLEAIASTGNADPTPYEDDSFWREALKRQPVSNG